MLSTLALVHDVGHGLINFNESSSYHGLVNSLMVDVFISCDQYCHIDCFLCYGFLCSALSAFSAFSAFFVIAYLLIMFKAYN